MDENFKVLQSKEVFEFLDGDGEAKELVQYNNHWFGLPYYTANDLIGMCRSFGCTGELGPVDGLL